MSENKRIHFDLPCVIFAGGKSRRMGRNKALLPFGEHPSLAQFQYERLCAYFSATYLSVKHAEKFPDCCALIIDETAPTIYAPTAGFVSIFKTLPNERFFALSVDTPFIDKAIIGALVDADRDDIDAVIARTPLGVHPLCGIYHRRLLSPFLQMEQTHRHSLKKLLECRKVVYVDFSEEESFLNLNHPQDYEAALEILKYRPKAEGRGETS